MQTVQEGDEIRISLIVSDSKIVNGKETSSGLDRIEVYNGDDLVAKVENISSTDYDGELISDISSEGYFMQNFIIKVYDRVGHVTVIESEQFAVDFSVPRILTDSFRIGELIDWVPSEPGEFDISVEIVEDEGLKEVVGDFSQLGLSSNEVADKCEETAPMHFKCYWHNRTVSFPGNIRLKISATDLKGNVGAAYVEREFKVDQVKPVILFVGTEGHYEGVNYANLNRRTKLIVRVQEGESGISPENVLFDVDYVGGMSGMGKRVPAENCSLVEEGVYECYLYVSLKRYGTAFLVGLKDNAGNSVSVDELAQSGRIDIVADEENPVIESVEVKATGGKYGNEKEYFESNDFMNIRVKVSDKIGVRCYADLRNVINGISNYVEADSCGLQDDVWVCEWQGLGPVRSGYAKAYYSIVCEDYVGNKDEKSGVIEILGKKIESHPDFWRVLSVKMRPSFLDRAMTKVMRSRVYFDVELGKSNPNVEFLDAHVKDCKGKTVPECGGDCLLSYYVVNNVVGSEHPYIVLEFQQFDSSEVNALEFNCTLLIFSKYGAYALQNPEEEVVNLVVPVGDSKLSFEKHLKRTIDRAKRDAESDLMETIRRLKQVMHYAKLLCNILVLFDKFRFLYDVINKKGESLRAVPPEGPVKAIALCYGMEEGKKATSYKGYSFLKQFCSIVSCRGPPGTWYSNWQRWVADQLGHLKEGGLVIPGAAERAIGLKPDPYKSFVYSLATLCIPGMIYNLEKLRQIKCRYLYCLKKEVPAGIATVNSCRKLKGYQQCKYFYGELFSFVPFLGALDQISGIIKSFLKDPVAWVNLAHSLVCKNKCGASNVIPVGCSIFAWALAAAELYQDVAAMYTAEMSLKYDFCKMAKRH